MRESRPSGKDRFVFSWPGAGSVARQGHAWYEIPPGTDKPRKGARAVDGAGLFLVSLAGLFCLVVSFGSRLIYFPTLIYHPRFTHTHTVYSSQYQA